MCDSSILCKKALVLVLPQLPTDTEQCFSIKCINSTCSSSHKSHLSPPRLTTPRGWCRRVLVHPFLQPCQPTHLSPSLLGLHGHPPTAWLTAGLWLPPGTKGLIYCLNSSLPHQRNIFWRSPPPSTLIPTILTREGQ